MDNVTTRTSRAPNGLTHTFHVRTDRQAEDAVVIGEVYEADTYQLIERARLGLAPKIMLDIGAHIGTAAVLARQLWPDCRILSFEPNRESFALLERNTEGMNVTCVNAAVSYTLGSCLTDGRGATGGGFVITKEAFEAAAQAKHGHDGFIYSIIDEEVATLTMEEILRRWKIDHVDLLKWDCEGGEIDCLRNMKDATAAKIALVVGEYHIEGAFEAFAELARAKMPHLEWRGKSAANMRLPIGWMEGVPRP